MAKITEETVKHVAHLARLTFNDEDVTTFAKQLDDIVNYAEQLTELDTTGVEPTTHVLDIKNVLRQDNQRQWISHEEALKNAPDQQDGQVKVPTIIEQRRGHDGIF